MKKMNKNDIANMLGTLLQTEHGLSVAQASAMVATLEANSGLKSGAVEGVTSSKEFDKNVKDYDKYMKKLKDEYGNVNMAMDGQSYPGIGIGNWRGEEARKLIEYCKANKTSWNDPMAQITYFIDSNKDTIEEMKQNPNMSMKTALLLANDPRNSLKKVTDEKKMAIAQKYVNAATENRGLFVGINSSDLKEATEASKKFEKVMKDVGNKIDPLARAKDKVKQGKNEKKDGKDTKKKAENTVPPKKLSKKEQEALKKKELEKIKKKQREERRAASRAAAANVLAMTFNNSDQSKGLRVKDIHGIMGIPPQFLPTADPRLSHTGTNPYGDNGGIGRVYATKILKYMPLLLIIPGVPEFMKGFSKKQKKTILGGAFVGNQTQEFADLLETGNGKYYSLKPNIVEYYEYVNTALRASALLLGINKIVYHNSQLSKIDWKKVTGGGSLLKEGGLFNQYNQAIPFYADCGTDVSESFSNSTSQSSLAGTINGLSDKARELSFLMGIGSNSVGLKLDRFLGQEGLASNIETAKSMINNIVGSRGNIFSSFIAKAETVMAGGRIVFPEIWSDSSFGRSYSCKMNLVAIAGDNLSLFLGIMVPMWHVLCLVLPRNADAQAYYSPFLVRAYYKGMFNIDMGIITDLSLTKGGEGEWNINGIPTQAELSFTIKDLYEELSMTNDDKFGTKLLSNVAELDYIANNCGININDTDINRTFKLLTGLAGGNVSNIINKAFDKFSQSINNRISDVFNIFY